MKIKQLLTSVLVIALFATPILYQLLNQSSVAPDVSISSITGEKIQLSTLQGKPVLITFWATSCAACIREIPDLKQLHTDFHDQGLHIIAIAMSYDPPNHVVSLSQQLNLPYTVALDVQGVLAKAFGRVHVTPSTFLISPQGLIVRQFSGAFNLQDMQHRINNLLQG